MQRVLMSVVAGVLFTLASACQSIESYSVRGVIMRIVQEPDQTGRVVVLHEAIEDFKNEQGKKTGMDVMTMSFGLSEDIPATQFAAGDKVTIRFQVRWKKSPRLWIESMSLLDPGITLQLDGYSVEESLKTAV